MLLRLETLIPAASMFIIMSLFFGYAMVCTSFTHCLFNLLWCDADAPEGRFNLHKTNAANEELVISLFYGREVQGGVRYTDCFIIIQLKQQDG